MPVPASLTAAGHQKRIGDMNTEPQATQRSNPSFGNETILWMPKSLSSNHPWGSLLGSGIHKLGGTAIHSQAFDTNMPHIQRCVLPLGFTCLSISHCLSSPKLRHQLPVWGSPPAFWLASLCLFWVKQSSLPTSPVHWGLRLVAPTHITVWEGQVHGWHHLFVNNFHKSTPTRNRRISEMEVGPPPTQSRAALQRLPNRGHLASAGWINGPSPTLPLNKYFCRVDAMTELASHWVTDGTVPRSQASIFYEPGCVQRPGVPSPECHTQGISKAVEYDVNSENKHFGVTQILVQILSPSLTILGHSLGKWL